MIKITKQQFLSHRHCDRPFGELLTTERAWFKDGKLLGVVLLDNTDKDWSFVALAADDTGVFRGFDLGTSYESEEAATDALAEAMGDVE